MLNSSYHVDYIEETIYLASELDFSFSKSFISKVREQYSKCVGYGYYDYECPSKGQCMDTVPTDSIDDSRVKYLYS